MLIKTKVLTFILSRKSRKRDNSEGDISNNDTKSNSFSNSFNGNFNFFAFKVTFIIAKLVIYSECL